MSIIQKFVLFLSNSFRATPKKSRHRDFRFAISNYFENCLLKTIYHKLLLKLKTLHMHSKIITRKSTDLSKNLYAHKA